jgi:uncharacterized protein YdiU (UPF0061 family)
MAGARRAERLADTLLPLISDDAEKAVDMATEVLVAFPAQYRGHLLRGQRAKLGLRRADPNVDDAAAGGEAPLRALFADADGLGTEGLATEAPDAWLSHWRARCASEDGADGLAVGVERASAMRRVNPNVIARNHRVEEALAAASNEGNLEPFERLLDAIRQPYDEAHERTHYAEPAPASVTAV